VGGYLSIYSNVELKADNLKSVGGYLSIYSNVELKADNLKSVGGYLYISSNVELKADNLKSVGGYLYIYSNVELNNLKSVGGDLSIYSNVELNNLKSVGGYLYISSNVELNNLKSVGGSLHIYSNAELNNLKSVGGDLSISSNVNRKLIKKLYENNQNNQWYLSDKSPEWILTQKIKKAEYKISGIVFEKEWFDKIRKDQLSPEEVFAIDNVEHRRIAYEYMDKAKMQQLKDFKVLDEKKDGCGKMMRVVSFTVQNMKKPLVFYHCIDASTNREYWLQMDGYKKCDEAKAGLWGLSAKDIRFVEEW
jgi:hypothetical protein